MWDILFWLFIIVVAAGAVVGAAWYYKTQLGDGESSSGLFGPRAEKRLGVIEQSNVDGRRKLVLIRRDNVEHLIMTGGPVDVVIETSIGADPPTQLRSSDTGSSAAVFSRAPRSFGKAVGE